MDDYIGVEFEMLSRFRTKKVKERLFLMSRSVLNGPSISIAGSTDL